MGLEDDLVSFLGRQFRPIFRGFHLLFVLGSVDMVEPKKPINLGRISRKMGAILELPGAKEQGF